MIVEKLPEILSYKRCEKSHIIFIGLIVAAAAVIIIIIIAWFQFLR